MYTCHKGADNWLPSEWPYNKSVGDKEPLLSSCGLLGTQLVQYLIQLLHFLHKLVTE